MGEDIKDILRDSEEVKDITVPLSFMFPADLEKPLSVRYKQASLQVLENFRRGVGMRLEEPLGIYLP